MNPNKMKQEQQENFFRPMMWIASPFLLLATAYLGGVGDFFKAKREDDEVIVLRLSKEDYLAALKEVEENYQKRKKTHKN